MNTTPTTEDQKPKIDTSLSGWFRALVPVDSMFQSFVCIGWFRSRDEAEKAIAKISKK